MGWQLRDEDALQNTPAPRTSRGARRYMACVMRCTVLRGSRLHSAWLGGMGEDEGGGVDPS